MVIFHCVLTQSQAYSLYPLYRINVQGNWKHGCSGSYKYLSFILCLEILLRVPSNKLQIEK